MHELLRRVREYGNPLIEGSSVTFVWEGTQPPLLIYDLADWLENPIPLEEVAPNTWVHTIQLDPRAYMEYAFLDPNSAKRPADPYNRHRIRNGLGQINHYFYMPEARPHPLTRRQPGAARGILSQHTVPVEPFYAGSTRKVTLYAPEAAQPLPLLVVYDGNDYGGRGRLPVLLDNLIDQGRIPPVAAALVHNRPRERFLEYNCSDSTVGFIANRVLPLAAEQLNLIDIHANPGAYTILGASMGGLMALFTSLRLPQVFGRALCQSGAYQLGEFETIVFDWVRHMPLPPVRLWMDVGRYEWLLDCNRQMHQLLSRQGFVHAYHEYFGGHNYTAWRNDLWQGLEYIFSPDF